MRSLVDEHLELDVGVRVRVHVRRQDEAPAVPGFCRLLIDDRVVRDQVSAGQLLEHRALIVDERGDVDIHVVTCLLAHPRVHGPSAA